MAADDRFLYGLPKILARAVVRVYVVIVLPVPWVWNNEKRTWLGRRFDRIGLGPHRAACFLVWGAQ